MKIKSHPARGAWIEIHLRQSGTFQNAQSHPARGAWIEMQHEAGVIREVLLSHPARGAWIEMPPPRSCPLTACVAPRKGCVD